VLLLSSESSINMEAALQVRLLNPRADIVVRSSSRQADLGVLLEERLPGVAVVDPVLLCAEAISSALRPETIPVSFEAHGQDFQILAQPWDDRRFQRPLRMPLQQPDAHPLLVMPRSLSRGGEDPVAPGHRRRRWLRRAARALAALGQWSRGQQLALLVLVLLAALGVTLFSAIGGWRQGVFVTLALLKGEYVDPVNVLLDGGSGLQAVSGWLIGGTLFYSLVGTLLTSALVAAILERLLRDRLGTSRPRLPRRAGRPVLLLGSGSLAERVARLQQRLGRTVLVVGAGRTAPAGAIGFDDLPTALQALDGLSARAVGLLSTDLLANLQGALSLQQRWPGGRCHGGHRLRRADRGGAAPARHQPAAGALSGGGRRHPLRPQRGQAGERLRDHRGVAVAAAPGSAPGAAEARHGGGARRPAGGAGQRGQPAAH
jgi:hypothetical protein